MQHGANAPTACAQRLPPLCTDRTMSGETLNPPAGGRTARLPHLRRDCLTGCGWPQRRRCCAQRLRRSVAEVRSCVVRCPRSAQQRSAQQPRNARQPRHALPCHGKAWRGLATTCHATPCHATPWGCARVGAAGTTIWIGAALRSTYDGNGPPPPSLAAAEFPSLQLATNAAGACTAPHRTARSAMHARIVPRVVPRARLCLAALHAYVRAPNVQMSAMPGGRLMPPLPSGQQYLRVMQGMGIGPSDPAYTRLNPTYTRPNPTYTRPDPTYTRPDPTYTRPDPTCALTPRPRSPSHLRAGVWTMRLLQWRCCARRRRRALQGASSGCRGRTSRRRSRK
jgi:hypothetical protein